MANPVSAPQAFTFGTQQLTGNLISFNGQSIRTGAVHRFLKRRGAIVEDMNAEPRKLSVELVFLGKNPAKDYNTFEAYVADNPTALLVHPVAGRYQAFCQGPDYQVNFAQAGNEIRVRVTFLESELDAQVRADVPDVATAAQLASSEKTNYQKAVAAYLGALTAANTAVASAKDKITGVVEQIDTFTDPITTLVTSALALPGVATSVVGALQSTQVLNEILDQQMSDFIDSANDLFSGDVVTAGAADSVQNLLLVVLNTSQSLQDLLVSVGSPAGAAEACGSIQEAAAACCVLSDAVVAARPQTVVIVVPRLIDLLSLCQIRYPNGDAIARCDDIKRMNHIKNPAAIPAGTTLVVPLV